MADPFGANKWNHTPWESAPDTSFGDHTTSLAETLSCSNSFGDMKSNSGGSSAAGIHAKQNYGIDPNVSLTFADPSSFVPPDSILSTRSRTTKKIHPDLYPRYKVTDNHIANVFQKPAWTDEEVKAMVHQVHKDRDEIRSFIGNIMKHYYLQAAQAVRLQDQFGGTVTTFDEISYQAAHEPSMAVSKKVYFVQQVIWDINTGYVSKIEKAVMDYFGLIYDNEATRLDQKSKYGCIHNQVKIVRQNKISALRKKTKKGGFHVVTSQKMVNGKQAPRRKPGVFQNEFVKSISHPPIPSVIAPAACTLAMLEQEELSASVTEVGKSERESDIQQKHRQIQEDFEASKQRIAEQQKRLDKLQKQEQILKAELRGQQQKTKTVEKTMLDERGQNSAELQKNKRDYEAAYLDGLKKQQAKKSKAQATARKVSVVG